MKKILLFLLIFLNFAFAAKEINLYLVKGIPVHSVERDASAARNIAIDHGERLALIQVLQNIDIDETNVSVFTKSEMQKAIKSMQIFNEKVTKNSYSATLNIEFNQDYITFILKKYNVSSYSSAYNSFLIIPYYVKNNRYFLFEKDNFVKERYATAIKKLKNMKIVEDDYFTNKITKDLKKNSNLSFATLGELADYYYVNYIVFIFADEDKLGNIQHKIFVLNSKEKKEANLSYNVNDDYNEIILDLLTYLNSISGEEKEKIDQQVLDNIELILEEGFTKVTFEISSLKDTNDIDKVLSYNDNVVLKLLKSINEKQLIYHIKLVNNDRNGFIKSLQKVGFVVTNKNEGIDAYLR
ncbi:MAG: hypothetical protein Ta2D_01280 [Rickettsiales bacterium]|nr:MAG: hypothetical protein Ta2D_01280 [Rickettsiales bacterium]